MPPSAQRNGVGSAAKERFLSLPEYRLALAAFHRLIKRRGKPNPGSVYLYGPSGSGKSHLVRQFLRELRLADSAVRVISVTGAEFADEYAAAASQNRLPEWRERFRDCAVFVCEEIPSLARRPESQRALVSIMEEVQTHHGQLVLTADRLPGEIAGLQPRLLNRCRGMAAVGIGPLSVASRSELLAHFASRQQMAISPSAVRLIAESRPLAPRELQAILVQLDAASRHEKRRLDMEFVRRYLSGEVLRPARTLGEIARAVARHFGVRLSELRSSSRTLELVTPRQCAMYLGRRLTDESLLKIATYFGRKNHTAVLQACRRAKSLMREEPALRRHLVEIGAALGAIGVDHEQDEPTPSE